MSASTKNGCIVIWKIENFTYCRHLNDDLDSPDFDVDRVRWRLYLEKVSGNDICLALEKVRGPKFVTVNYESALIDADGSLVYLQNSEKYKFKKGSEAWIHALIPCSEVVDRKDELLPNNTLTVYCRIWKTSWHPSESKQYFLRTRIRRVEASFIWNIERFSLMDRENERCRGVKDANADDLVEWIASTSSFQSVPIAVVVKKVPCVAKFKVSVLDDQYLPLMTPVECERVFKSGTKQELFTINRQSGGVLTLLCECAISDGDIEFEKIEKVHYGSPELDHNGLIAGSLITSFEIPKLESDESRGLEPEDKCEKAKLSSWSCDFRDMFEEGLFTDFKIRVREEVFPVHKAVLAARSDVFKAMFSADMKEASADVVHISDVDVATVRKMLHHIYTDSREDLDWESAAKLYFAADKYGLPNLRDHCSSAMVNNLSDESVCQVLQLADRHSDAGLKQFAMDYIHMKGPEFIASSEWEEFMKAEIMLAAETMRLMHLKKIQKTT